MVDPGTTSGRDRVWRARVIRSEIRSRAELNCALPLFLHPSHQRDTAHRPIGTGRLRALRRFGYWGDQIGHLRDSGANYVAQRSESLFMEWCRPGGGGASYKRCLGQAVSSLSRQACWSGEPALERHRSFARRNRSLRQRAGHEGGVIIGSNVDGLQLDDPRFGPIWEKINRLRLRVFEHPMFPRNSAGLEGFELLLRLGLIFDTSWPPGSSTQGYSNDTRTFLTSWRIRVAHY
jgi:hypothetical protein